MITFYTILCIYFLIALWVFRTIKPYYEPEFQKYAFKWSILWIYLLYKGLKRNEEENEDNE